MLSVVDLNFLYVSVCRCRFEGTAPCPNILDLKAVCQSTEPTHVASPLHTPVHSCCVSLNHWIISWLLAVREQTILMDLMICIIQLLNLVTWHEFCEINKSDRGNRKKLFLVLTLWRWLHLCFGKRQTIPKLKINVRKLCIISSEQNFTEQRC